MACYGGDVVDKSGEAGDLTAKRRFLEVVATEVGDVDITKADVLWHLPWPIGFCMI